MGLDNYIIYDFFNKQLITDRPIITSLLDIGTNGSCERTTEIGTMRYAWDGDDRLILEAGDICNLWDIETNEMYYIQFDVSILSINIYFSIQHYHNKLSIIK